MAGSSTDDPIESFEVKKIDEKSATKDFSVDLGKITYSRDSRCVHSRVQSLDCYKHMTAF